MEEHLEPSNQESDYQPRHEEGNFFSYPQALTDVEGYYPKAALGSSRWITWTKGGDSSTSIRFEQSKIDSQEYNDEVKESELTKAVSAIATFFGADDPNPLPPYSSHSESFTKSLSTSEQIDIDFYGRSDIQGEEAAHEIITMPYIAREGTLKVAHAVKLKTNTARLWGAESRYRKSADPSLVLPGKYNRYSSSIVANDNNASAMQLRGMRFYVPALDLYSDKSLLGGLTYEIKVPIYNASFVNADNVEVSLYYMQESEYDFLHPEKSMSAMRRKLLQTVNVSLHGWGDNKGWAKFTWPIPRNMATGNYVLFVQIDPNGKLAEVHESRLDDSGNIVDVGGNNEGYFKVNISSEAAAKEQRKITGSGVSASSSAPRALTPRGTIYRAVSRKSSGGERGAVSSSATEGLGNIDVMTQFSDTRGWDFGELLQIFGDGLANGEDDEALVASDDVSHPIVMEITYNGDEYYPEAYLRGYNYKAGTEEVDNVFLNHRLALVPHTTTTLTFNLNKSYMDYDNGTGFEIVVPEIAAEAVREEIARSVEITTQDVPDESGNDTAGDDTAGDDNSGETTDEDFNPSSSGCNAFTGSLGVLGLLGLALLSSRKHE